MSSYTTAASVRFRGTRDGKLDESAIDKEETDLGDHALYGSGDDKEDYSYWVVDADGYLRRGNVESAHSLGCRGDCPSDETHQRKLRALNKQFDDPPIDFDSQASMTPDPTETDDFEKRVELLEKDDAEQIARGAVLVPDRLDHQGDFLRADTISDLRANWTQRVSDGDAHPGVMHAVFPGDAMELVEDRQLDAPETIGDKTLPAGSWVQGWQYTDDQLWQLVDDGVLGGFSIGGTAKGTLYEPGTMPDDVSIPDDVQAELDEADLTRDDIMVREITDGRILETSTVDRPAVPDAVHAETKALAKAAPALTENIVAARLYLEARGHDPDDARRLAEFLQEHKQADDSGGLLTRAKSWFRGGDRGGGERARVAETPDTDPRDEKAGRTLSEANVQSAMAVVDAGLDMLDRSDVDHGRMRFTDDDTTEFDIGAYGRDTADGAGGPSDEAAHDADDSAITMTDELEDTLDAITERLDTIESQLDDGDDAGGEEKTTDDDADPTTEEKVDELADATKTVAEQVEQVAEQVEQMANAQGVSQQADTGTAKGDGDEKTWGENSPFARGGD